MSPRSCFSAQVLLAAPGFQFRAGDFELCVEISVERKDGRWLKVAWQVAAVGRGGGGEAGCPSRNKKKGWGVVGGVGGGGGVVEGARGRGQGVGGGGGVASGSGGGGELAFEPEG